MPPNFVKNEKVWNRAKELVKKEYGDIKKSDPDKFYALTTTIYKSICKSPDYDCGKTYESTRSLLNRMAESIISEAGVTLFQMEQIMGWHIQDAAYLRKWGEKQSGEKRKNAYKAAVMHELAAKEFKKVLAAGGKGIRKAQKKRMDALRFTRDRT